MSEPINHQKIIRVATVELEPEILTDYETGAPIAVDEPRRFTGYLSPAWDEILEDGGRNEH